jgi:hypothetical protein
VLKLDDFLTEVTLTLNAESAAELIHKVAIQTLRNRPRGSHHGTERRHAVDRARQAQKKADALVYVGTQSREVE